MENDTPIETERRDPGLPESEWIPLADLIARAAGRQARLDRDIDQNLVGATPRDRLRWRLVLLVGLRLTQEKYVAWLRSEPHVDAQYLAEEEAFLDCLIERIHHAMAALRKAPTRSASTKKTTR